MIKKITLILVLALPALFADAQNNNGSPYSAYGLGLFPDNNGPYMAMGGVSAALRDNFNINFLNPASYTALDSNRFYFQLAMTGEYTFISSHKKSTDYQVAQNGNFNLALRLMRNLYFSMGFTEKSDIGYDLLYTHTIAGSYDSKFNQNIAGEGGINDIYGGLAWKYKDLSVGLNVSYLFGKVEKQQTLTAQIPESFYIRTSELNRIHDFVFSPGIQYDLKLTPKSRLVAGYTMSFTQKLSARQDFQSYKVSTSSGNSTILDDEKLHHGYVRYPLRLNGGLCYNYKNRWSVAGDYTYQRMSLYETFKIREKLKDYHKIALGGSFTPDATGRRWWQRNTYMAGAYFINSEIRLKEKDINTWGVTLGSQMPFYTPRGGSLLLGVALDMGVRGTESNGLIQEKFVKVRLNIAFKELWFAKSKIN